LRTKFGAEKGKKDLPPFGKGGESRKRPTLVVGINPIGKSQFMWVKV
jgi:hypothetical protein